MRLDDSEIARLRALCEAALAHSPGPWSVDWADDDFDRDGGRGVYGINDANNDNVVVGDSGVYPPRGAVAELIAEAPAMRGLLDEIERLRALLNEAYHAMRPMRGNWVETRIAHSVAERIRAAVDVGE